MQEEELVNLITKIQRRRCEGQQVEVKKAFSGCPTSLYDTLSSFSNQDTGGTIVFGLDEDAGFAVTGVYDAQDLQHRVSQQCREMEPIVRALFTAVDYDGKMVVSAEIPPVEPTYRPVFYRGKGRLGGAFVRVGDADEQMTEFEIYSYESYRQHVKNDRRIIADADASLFDGDKLSDYIRSVKKGRPNLAALVADADIPEKVGIVREGHPSLAGLMVFSKYPQIALPQLCVTAVVIPGKHMGDGDEEGTRFIDNQQLTGSIPDMLEAAEAFVMRSIRKKTIITPEGKRLDAFEYPMKAIREAILNALIHRDYSPYTESSPVRIEIYSNRIEISNKGGLYGAVPISALGRIDIGKRNAFLVELLECLGQTENRNSGIATMRAECQSYNLPPPSFSVIHGEFKVVFKNSRPADDVVFERPRAEETILAFCEVPRSRDELAAFTRLNQSYTMSYLIRPLLQSGKLVRTDPESPKSPFQHFVRAF